jgi:hypothetical protein
MAITIDGTNGLSSDNAALKLDGTTLVVDEANNRVGVGTASPAVAMDVVGQVRASTGILFGSDTAAANALDDYEEGTWTPSDQSGAGLTFSNTSGNCLYTKVGRFVTLTALLVFPSTANGNTVVIGGLPFNPASTSNGVMGGFFTYKTDSDSVSVWMGVGGTLQFYSANGGDRSNANLSADDVRFVVVYQAA